MVPHCFRVDANNGVFLTVWNKIKVVKIWSGKMRGNPWENAWEIRGIANNSANISTFSPRKGQPPEKLNYRDLCSLNS